MDAPVETAVPRASAASWWERLQAFRERHAKKEIALFFGAGFLFDVFTLDRIDSAVGIAMHTVYLVLLGGLLVYEQRHALQLAQPPKWIANAWRFSEDALHFLLGSLLSSFSLFYFKSASGLNALMFMAAMFGVLVANELPRFRKTGPVVRMALYGFCLTSFFAYVYPIVFGFLSVWLFLLAVTSALVMGALFFWLGVRWSGQRSWAVRRLAVPFAGMQALLLALYFLGAIPPLPMSVQKIGIYHSVERPEPGVFVLHHQRPWWKVWQSGDQDFLARSGDRIYVFARIFAPTHFRDRVKIRWQYDDPSRGWLDQGTFTFSVTGGREQGFRGYAYKENYKPGAWRVSVETDDDRVIGQLHFRVQLDPSTDPRSFQFEHG